MKHVAEAAFSTVFSEAEFKLTVKDNTGTDSLHTSCLKAENRAWTTIQHIFWNPAVCKIAHYIFHTPLSVNALCTLQNLKS